MTSLVLWACSSSKQPGQLGDTPPVNGSSDAGVWLDGTTSVDAGSVSINTLGIDFGTTECGKQAQPKTLIVQNTGVLPISWNSSFLRGDESPYAVSPTGGTLLGRESKIVTVAPKRIGVPASTATAAFNDTLIVNTDRVGDVPKTITISQAVSGAVLVFNPASINLGLVPVGQEGTASLSILNRGSGPADF
ncbi:MAG: hypothetical protein WCI05_19720, partial [Myxococcales bacterium]